MGARRSGSGEAEADARRLLHADVGEVIRAVRVAQGVGQAECARLAGIDVSSLFRIEKGGQNLTVETLARLALALSVEMEVLLQGIEPDPRLIDGASA